MEENELQRTLPVGTILKSPKYDYRIEEVLGQGGFGITYKVSTTVMFDKVPIFTYFTIKEHFMKEACERDEAGNVGYSKPLQARVEESRGDFLAEARRLNEISGKNPNVVPVSEVFEANNTVYYVMEYLNGGTLRDLVKANGALTEEAALDIELPIAKAVAFLHSHHINHLDIKPENIMFRVDYHSGKRMPVLIDFGLAKHFDDKGKPTSTIRVQGCSDGFAPVEQYSGLSTFSPQADVYALGAVLYYMLVGRVPIIATEMQRDTVAKALPPTVSDAVKLAITHAMAYNKFDRTPSVDNFVHEICPTAQPDVIPTPEPKPAPTPEPEKDWSEFEATATRIIKKKDNKMLKLIIAIVVVLAIGGFGAWLAISSQSKSSKTDDGSDGDDMYMEYVADCQKCDSLIENGDSGDNREMLIEAKSLLEKIKETEESDEATNSDANFNLSSKKGLSDRLEGKLQVAYKSWEMAGDVQLELPDYEIALQSYETAKQLYPGELADTDSLQMKIDYCKANLQQ